MLCRGVISAWNFFFKFSRFKLEVLVKFLTLRGIVLDKRSTDMTVKSTDLFFALLPFFLSSTDS
jgi:hypothetical protein